MVEDFHNSKYTVNKQIKMNNKFIGYFCKKKKKKNYLVNYR